ncbi:MAG: Xaa-Pro peptidase family protein [Alphaproteobacteria bacterium]
MPRDASTIDIPFPVAEFEGRLAKIRAGMRERGVDLLLLTGPENIYYVSGYYTTGYHVYQALLIPVDAAPCFVVRKLELGNVHHHSWIGDGAPVEDGVDPTEATAERIRRYGAERARIGYEDQAVFLPPATLDRLRARLPGARFVPASGIVEACRMIKSPAEIAYLRRAAEAASAGMRDGAEACIAGRTENDVAAAVYGGLVRAGSEYAGSPPYVTAGARSAVGHATYAMNVLEPADHVWIEIGASIKRYNAGIGRVVTIGTPKPELARVADLMGRAIEAMIEAVRPGVTSGEIDRAGRGLVEAAGLGIHWQHRGGYGLGISFPPGLGEGHIMDIKPNDPRRLEPGMVFHLVPIVLVPGVGAVGCTDTVLVTATGHELLTTMPRPVIRR